MTSAWEQADKAYQAHHAQCPQCIAAGLSPGRQLRCPLGQSLWENYLSSGDPPHFTWLQNKKGSSNEHRTQRPTRASPQNQHRVL